MGLVPQSHFQQEYRTIIFLVTHPLPPHASDLGQTPAAGTQDTWSPLLSFPQHRQTFSGALLPRPHTETCNCELLKHASQLRKYMGFEFLANSPVQWTDVRIRDLPHARTCLLTGLWFPCRKAKPNPNPKEKFSPSLLALFPPSDKPQCSWLCFNSIQMLNFTKGQEEWEPA